MYYNRQIIYIDYMEAGSKVKNAGFLRREETEDTITWNMQIKGLYETDTGFFDLRDETGALIDKVLLKRGTGSYERQFTAGGVSRGGRDFSEICGISIRLSPGREVIGRWKGAEECLKAADISVTEERPRKYEMPQAGRVQYERLQGEASNVMPEIDPSRAEQRTRGISFSEMAETVPYQAEPRMQGLSFTETQGVAQHPADQQTQGINSSGIQKTDPYQAGEQYREVLQAITEMPERKTADMEGKQLAAVKTEAGRPEILQYQKPFTEKQKDTESAEEGSGFQMNRDDVDSVMENGAISAEKLCRRCMHKRFAPQEKKREPESKKAAPAAEGGVFREGGIQEEGISSKEGMYSKEGIPGKEGMYGKEGIPSREGISGKEGMPHKEGMSRSVSGVSGGGGVLKENGTAKGKRDTKEIGDDLMQEEFFEDKWEQLRHMYPTVHPFADERQYLSITPRDFVILGSEHQKMVRNSFLLHGYYNYRHIILGKFNVGGEEKFYLGVPGVYYDREKMAAEMFGFEAFEGKQTPAEPGSFGYYMKSVRI